LIYGLLTRPADAQYILAIFYTYIVSTPACFDASASSSGSYSSTVLKL